MLVLKCIIKHVANDYAKTRMNVQLGIMIVRSSSTVTTKIPTMYVAKNHGRLHACVPQDSTIKMIIALLFGIIVFQSTAEKAINCMMKGTIVSMLMSVIVCRAKMVLHALILLPQALFPFTRMRVSAFQDGKDSTAT